MNYIYILEGIKNTSYMEILLSSTVIVAFITGIFSFIVSKKQDALQYITAERKLWREEIRDIAKRINKADKKHINPILVELKVRLNPYGQYYSKGYGDDAHIWEVIHAIEDKNISDKHYRELRSLLVDYIALLLKYDWERSKDEARCNMHAVVCNVVVVLIAGLFGGCVYFYTTDDNRILMAVVVSVVYIVIYAIMIFMLELIVSHTVDQMGKSKAINKGSKNGTLFVGVLLIAGCLVAFYYFVVYKYLPLVLNEINVSDKQGLDMLIALILVLNGVLIFVRFWYDCKVINWMSSYYYAIDCCEGNSRIKGKS